MSQIKDFALHLRLNYNFLILSAPFFLGSVYMKEILNPYLYTFSFLLVYIFLFGGANAYNSHFDKDNGPIGGLEHPPKMTKWMYYGSWFIQILGLILSIFINYVFSLSSGGNELSTEIILGAIGATLIILSMYPFSQAYQIEEDKKRGDRTFAVKMG